MTTIAARLAQTSFTSSGPAEARQRALYLYRAWCRSSQEVVDLYALNVSATQIRSAIRRRFEANRHITDTRAIDVLLLKGWQEYQETMNVWKQPDHVLGILLEDQGASRPPRTFLQKFYEGRDEDSVLPAASGTY
ncbi:hypothetical protein HWV62_1420 [Athelia sp. TMB]|nr:hypothetical protein HWV62_2462 [Athelia sp. TMB]KAF7978200.1 hypothetical protein HWV62_1420 [Athelia sp. TMB]